MDDPASDRGVVLRRRLLEFYDERRRDLPWRGEDDPYRVWVSEVMLQQTRVDTVIPYYRRWMERFPSLDDLADASREQVLQAWKGLGYYSRARRLHRAARLVRERHGGTLPRSVDELEELPGVGPYTAGAVASIAFGVSAPAVDGNARRVLSRLFDLPDPGDAELRRRARELLDPGRPGASNQALMELGARICTPRSPDCGGCPVEEQCLARSRGTVELRPPSRKRGPVPEREVAVAVPVDGQRRTLLVRRPDDGLLGGMWEFPSAALAEDDELAATARRAAEDRGVRVAGGGGVPLPEVPHAFSHLRVTYRPRLFPDAVLPPPGSTGDGLRVVPLDALDGTPLPVAQQKIGGRAGEALAGSD